RDLIVTGVQTCALPILVSKAAGKGSSSTFHGRRRPLLEAASRSAEHILRSLTRTTPRRAGRSSCWRAAAPTRSRLRTSVAWRTEIGRASCRERVEVLEG